MIQKILFFGLFLVFSICGNAQKQVENIFHETKWAESLDDITELPVGIRETKDGMEYTIIITQATFLPDKTLVNAYARLTVPDSQTPTGKKQLFFGATEIPFSYQGQIVGDMRLSLLGDLTVSSNKNWEFLLRGGKVDTSTGNSENDLTYLTFDCEGLKEISLNGIVRISKDLVVPVEPQTFTPIIDKAIETAVSVKAEHWNNLLLKISLPPFAITKQALNTDKGAFVFQAEDVILDMSDTNNASEMTFPKGYETYLVSDPVSWRGFYMGKLQITLPEEFKKSDKRLSFAAERFILDSYGISGSFSVENLIRNYEGITAGGDNAWRYNLDFLQAEFVASKIKGGSLSGSILLPIQSPENVKNNTEKSGEKGIRFAGAFTDDDYMLKASSLGTIDFDLWKAKAIIAPSSYLEFRVKNKEFFPKVVLDGSMSLREKQEGESLYQFDGITFQQFTLQVEAPYISANYFGAKGKQQLANFPVSINDIAVGFQGNNANLKFNIQVGLQEDKFSAEGGFKITAKKEKAHWKYDSYDITELALDKVDIKVATVSGKLKLMKNDPTYGNGFSANLNVHIEEPSIKLEAEAIFGSREFRYWSFDASVDNLNIPASFVNITGFVGGAYYRMKPKGGTMTSRNGEGIGVKKAFDFVPDESIGLGLKAGVLGNFKTDEVASFVAVLSIQTNRNGGLSRIGIDGETVVMSAIKDHLSNPFQSLQEGFSSQINQLIDMEKFEKADKIVNVLPTDNSNTPKSISLDKNNKVKEAPIYAQMSMNYDFAQKSFHANMETYINVAGGIIKGTGNNGLAGRAVIHIDPKDWYIHIGTSREMMGLQVGFGNLRLKSQSYFMVGTKVYETPQPPAKVAEILNLSSNALGYMQNLNQLEAGTGVAFGSHFNFDTGDINAGFIYARFAAGLGADMMLKNYGNAHCKNRSGELGINGWYANGQTYVYLQGELGIKVKLFFVRKNIPILKAGVAAILQGSGPNPFWARGYLGGHYNVLGGLVKGRFRLKMEFGEQCEIANNEVLGGMKIISDVSPSDKTNNVDVFLSPQASFNLEIDKPIVIPEDDGDHTYIVKLEKFELTDPKGKVIEGVLNFGKTNDVLNFIPSETLSSTTQYKAVVQVSFQELKNGSYLPVMVDGKKATETQERTFTTGVAPEYIPNKNIRYAYPVLDQKNYFIGESKNAFIQLKQGQAYLFEADNWDTMLYLTDENGQKTSVKPHYDSGKQLISYSIPKLDTRTQYTLSIVSFSKNKTANQQTTSVLKDEEKSGYDAGEGETTTTIRSRKAEASSKETNFERLSYSFKTSRYKTLKQKVNAFQLQRKLWIKVSSDVVLLQNNMNTDEPFETAELLGTPYTDEKPLLYAEAVLGDAYDAIFKKYLYTYSQNSTILERENTETAIGFPPKEALRIFSPYVENLSNQTYDPLLKRVFPYRYDVFVYYKKDWTTLGKYIANKYLLNGLSSELEKEFMEQSFPVIPEKKYKATLQYRLPNGEITSEIPYFYEF